MTESLNRSDSTARSPILRMSRGPALGWLALVFGGTLILQSLSSLQIIPVLFFNGLILLFASLIWHADALTIRRPWIYLIIQSLLVNGAALLMPDGSVILLAALNPLIISQGYVIYPQKRAFYSMLALNVLLFGSVTLAISDNHLGALYVIWFVPMCVVLLGITKLAVRQLQSQFRTQAFLAELTVAHQQVEELTIANERERMARDLHDTLAQGLAGIVMQLEAVDAHLTGNRSERAQEIVHHAMGRARLTLEEAREAIDNLRSLSIPRVDFVQAVMAEVERYRQDTSLLIHLDMNLHNSLPKLHTQHGLHIVRECLANVAKHAEATQVWIGIRSVGASLMIEIRDDGEGFNTALIGQSMGHYGLVGIKERVLIIRGIFEIDSGSHGTSIRIYAPLPEGDLHVL